MFLLASALASTAVWMDAPAAQTGSLLFFVDLPAGHAATEDGRLLLMLAKDGRRGEPRFQVGTGADAQQIFGVDVEGWRGRTSVVIDAAVPGFPLNSISNIPPGTYTVQALLHKYETFTRADGFTVKLPMDRGEGQQWARAPGNLYSTPVEVRVDPNGAAVTITLDKVIPPIAPPADTRYIKHERIQSALLTKFWGRPMHLGANVLLPEGWDTHPEARYPLFIYHGHFPYTFTGFRPEPPDPTLEPDFAARFNLAGYNRIQQQYAHQFYKDWTGPGFPRAIVIEIQHATPFYDDSYAVNSANAGPWGDAIVKELLPYIEKKYRGIGQGWARFMYGGSTGGWEAMAAQVFYPDDFNGAYIACPDPIDFRAYTVVNLYEDGTRTTRKRLEADAAARPPQLSRARGRDARGDEPARDGARHEDAVGPAVGRLGSHLLTRRARRLSCAHLGQADRRHRQEGRRVLARELRPRAHPEARLGEGPRARSSRASSTSTSATWTTTT
jgi:hypothetical protein